MSDFVDRVAELRAQGVTAPAIAAELNLRLSTVHRCFDVLDLERPRLPAPDEPDGPLAVLDQMRSGAHFLRALHNMARARYASALEDGDLPLARETLIELERLEVALDGLRHVRPTLLLT